MDIKKRRVFLQKNKNLKRKEFLESSQGFATLFITGFLVIFVSLILFLQVFYEKLETYNLALAACYFTLMESQENMKKPFKSLIKLNPKARKLRKKLKKAQKKLLIAAATMNSPLIKLAQKRILQIKIDQVALKARQVFYLVKFKLQHKKSRKTIQKRLRKIDPKIQVDVSESQKVFKITPKLSLTPDYVPLKDFHKKQAITASFETEEFPVICGATLIKEKNKWKSQIYKPKDRFF